MERGGRLGGSEEGFPESEDLRLVKCLDPDGPIRLNQISDLGAADLWRPRLQPPLDLCLTKQVLGLILG